MKIPPAEIASIRERLDGPARELLDAWEDGGPGAPTAGYAYPVLVAMVDQDEDLVYNMTKAMVELYDGYKGNAPGINHTALIGHGFGPAQIEKVEAALASAFDIRFVFNQWTLGEEFCTKTLGIPAAKLGLAVDHWTIQRAAEELTPSVARAMLIAAQTYSGEQLHAIGAVHRIEPTQVELVALALATVLHDVHARHVTEQVRRAALGHRVDLSAPDRDGRCTELVRLPMHDHLAHGVRVLRHQHGGPRRRATEAAVFGPEGPRQRLEGGRRRRVLGRQDHPAAGGDGEVGALGRRPQLDREHPPVAVLGVPRFERLVFQRRLVA